MNKDRRLHSYILNSSSRYTSIKRSSASLLLIVVLCHAQFERPNVTLRVTSRLVEVGVVAKNSRGGAVGDLSQADFEVYDEGKRQEIKLFVKRLAGSEPAVDIGPVLTSSVKPVGRVFSNRTEQATTTSPVTVILIDQLNTRWADQVFARQEMIKFLKQLRPEDRVGIYTMGLGDFRILHEFTRDSTELVRRLVAWHPQAGKKIESTNPTGTPDQGIQFVNWLGNYLSGSTTNAGPGTTFAALAMNGIEMHHGIGVNREIYDLPRISLKVLAAVASHLAGIPGRKNLIWMTGGVPIDADHYRDLLDAMRVVNNAHVAIYAIDARGLVPFVPDASFQVSPGAPVGYGPDQATTDTRYQIAATQQSMSEVADRTGGQAFYNRNDIMTAVQTAYDDARVTYTLGYYPSASHQDGKFHQIAVKVRGRKDVRLRYRKGYVDEQLLASDPGRRSKELQDAIWSPADATALTVAAEISTAAVAGTCDITVRVDIRGVSLEQVGDRASGRVDVVIAQKNEQGEQFDVAEQGLGLLLTSETYDRMLKGGLMYRRPLILSPQATIIRVIARDSGSGNVGSLTIPIKHFAQTVSK